MNRLWVRLSLYFSMSVMLGVLALVIISLTLNNHNIRRYAALEQIQQDSGLLVNLHDFYRRQQSWDGVGSVLFGAQAMLPQGRNEALALYLVDPSGQIIESALPRTGIPPQSPITADNDFQIQIDNEIVGQLWIKSVPLSQPSPALGILGIVGRVLVFLAIGIGILGLIFGVVFSRSLTAPLSRLADAARAIGARNFNRHVKPEGSEEMAEVAIAFNSMVDALAESEQLRRNLVADVAHELRTPLSVLQGNLRAILDDVYPLEKGEIARLYDQSRLLNRLVEELRELSQAEAGQLPLNLTHVDPVSLISDTVADFGPAAEAESVTLTTDLPTTLPPLQADTARLSQVLHNLLANALRHTPAGGTITVSAAPSDKAIHLTIRDTGEGISAEHLPHIFDRFYRGDRARARADGGAGLGLAIVRAIVEAHGGTVSAASSGLAGEGSTFVISLPCPKSPAAASEQWPLHPAAASSD